MCYYGSLKQLNKHPRRHVAMSPRTRGHRSMSQASDPSSFYPSFQLECLRQPYDSQQQSEESRDGKDDSGDHDISASTPLATHRLSSIGGVTTTSTPSTTVDDNASVAMDGEDDGGTPPPSPPRDETGARRAGNHGTPTRSVCVRRQSCAYIAWNLMIALAQCDSDAS